MNLNLIYGLLTEKNISFTLKENILKENTGPWNDYKKLQLNNGNWELIHVKWERANGDEELIKSFKDESIACKLFYLYRLSYYFTFQYVLPFYKENKDINFYGGELFTLENLKEGLHRAGIPKQYYSLDGKLKEHSVVLERINEKKSKMLHIGRNLQKVSETLVIYNWEIYDEIFTDAYMIYLLDQECDELIKKGVIEERFTDEDYRFFLSPDF